jgi:hypothetical protein
VENKSVFFVNSRLSLGAGERTSHNIQYIDKNRQENSVLPGKNFVLFPHNGCGIIKQLDDKERR